MYLAEKFHTPDYWYPADLQKRARVNEYLSWQHSAIRMHGSKILWFKVSEVYFFTFKGTVVNRIMLWFQQIPSWWLAPIARWLWDWNPIFRIAIQLTTSFLSIIMLFVIGMKLFSCIAVAFDSKSFGSWGPQRKDGHCRRVSWWITKIIWGEVPARQAVYCWWSDLIGWPGCCCGNHAGMHSIHSV